MNPLKIKVLLVITKSNWGGAQRYVYDLATRLPTDRYEVEVILGGAGALSEKLAAAGIPVISLPELGRDVDATKDLKVLGALFRIFRQKKPDVVHLNSSKIGGLGALAARIARVPLIVFTAHGWAFNENRGFGVKLAIKFLYWITMVLAHRTIAVSHYMKRQVSQWPYIGDKIVVIHNAVEPIKGFAKNGAREALAQRFPALRAGAEKAGRHPLWIGTIAELHHIKGHEYAIRAVRMACDASPGRYIIYAISGEGEDRTRLEQLITELDLQDNVFLLGHVDHAAEYLPALDIFMLASLSEGLGYVLLEAGMASLPVVATAVGGIPEVVGDMESGILVQPRKPRELAHALSFMIEHPDERKGYGAALKEKVTKEFSIEKMVRETERVYGK